tara:strand:+ start:2003 stop:2440 length:438 start_codon:yes stop_codon:yes gene_type:complete
MSNNITTRKQRVDLNAEQRAQVVTQYFQEGVGSGALAEFYDVCEATIHAITKPRRLELKKAQHLQEAMKLRKAISKAKPRAGGVVRSKKNLVKEDHPDQNLSVSWMSSESDAFITGMSIAYGLSRAQVVDKLIDIAKASNATKQN